MVTRARGRPRSAPWARADVPRRAGRELPGARRVRSSRDGRGGDCPEADRRELGTGRYRSSARVPGERTGAGVAGGVGEVLLDPEELVVLRDPLGAGRGTGLDLVAVGGDREVGDGDVLGLTRPVAHHAPEAVAVRELHRVEGLGERA